MWSDSSLSRSPLVGSDLRVDIDSGRISGKAEANKHVMSTKMKRRLAIRAAKFGPEADSRSRVVGEVPTFWNLNVSEKNRILREL